MESEVVSEGGQNRKFGNLVFVALNIITVLVTLFLYHNIAVSKAYIKGQITALREVNHSLREQHDLELQQIRDATKEAEQQLLKLERISNDVNLRIIEIKNGITVKNE